MDPYIHDQTPWKSAFLSPCFQSEIAQLTLFPLTPLPTDIKQLVRQVPDDKGRLADPRRLDPCAQDVLVGRCKVGRPNPSDRIEVAEARKVGGSIVSLEGLVMAGDNMKRRRNSLRCAVVDLQFVPSAVRLPDPSIVPQPVHSVRQSRWHDIPLDLRWTRHDQVVPPSVARVELDAHVPDPFEEDAHGLNGVAKDDLLVRFSFVHVVRSEVRSQNRTSMSIEELLQRFGECRLTCCESVSSA